MNFRTVSRTHFLYSFGGFFKYLEESMNMLDLVQNHFLFFRDPPSLLDSVSLFTFERLVSSSSSLVDEYYLRDYMQK